MANNRDDKLAQSFEAQRPHLRAVAYRMLGSTAKADDVVQEAWLRMSRTDTDTIDTRSRPLIGQPARQASGEGDGDR